MNVFDFVEKMDKKYGEDWKSSDLTKEEKELYSILSDDWNEMMYEFHSECQSFDSGGPLC